MRIVVSGASGFIGRGVSATLRREGHEVVALTRGPARPGAIHWDPPAGVLDPAALEGFDAVVHLAGENAGAARWTSAKKASIRSSRTVGTTLLAGTIARLARRPTTLVSASGINVYGSPGDTLVDEESPLGDGFLAGVCHEWEAATAPASAAAVRVVILRIGMVLAPNGGGLGRLLPLFRLGLGGPTGSGRQWMSWVTRDDVAAAVSHAVGQRGLAGVVNLVSPNPVRNRDFVKTLGRVLHRPALLPAPAFALRLVLGEMADDLLLASIRVSPAALARSGFGFRDPDLEPALRRMLAG